ncbi:hypothetical protein [Micromonospora sp. NBC_00617]|uniref:hypothetical protein n=1 Tax=Micromonospora sp. NBC_00617 TaxID=2903587 RepID=UPI00386938D0
MPGDLGWTPVGVDLSGGQLRHARGRLPVARGDASTLPIADTSLPAAMCGPASRGSGISLAERQDRARSWM